MIGMTKMNEKKKICIHTRFESSISYAEAIFDFRLFCPFGLESILDVIFLTNCLKFLSHKRISIQFDLKLRKKKMHNQRKCSWKRDEENKKVTSRLH